MVQYALHNDPYARTNGMGPIFPRLTLVAFFFLLNAEAAEFRKLEMPRAAALLIQKFPNDDVLAAYAARLCA